MDNETNTSVWQHAVDTLANELKTPVYLAGLDGNRLATSVNFPLFCQLAEKKGRILCQSCRQDWSKLDQTTITTCHAGLTNIIAPVRLDGQTMGVLVASSLAQQPPNVTLIAKKLGIPDADVIDDLRDLPKLPEASITPAAAMIHATAKLLPFAARKVQAATLHATSSTSFTEFSHHIHATLDVQHIASIAVDTLAREFKLHDCTLMLDTKTYRHRREDAERFVSIERALWAHVSSNRSLLTIRDLSKDFLTSTAAGAKDLPISIVAFPLIKDHQYFGILACYGATADNADALIAYVDATTNALANALQLNEMRETAITDSLTNLYNKRYFLEALQAELHRGVRFNRSTSLLIFDVDHFKQYNDTYGHPDGDQLLKMLGKLVKDNAGSFDTPCRYGGEEFVVILPETKPDHAYLVAEKLRQIIEHTDFPNRKVTVSIGLVTNTNSTCSPEQLMQEADKALYKSKHAGRNKTTHVIVVDKNLAPIDVEEADRRGKKVCASQ